MLHCETFGAGLLVRSYNSYIAHLHSLLPTMAPKKRPSPLNTQGSASSQNKRYSSHSPTSDPSSPSQPKGRRRRQQAYSHQPRDLEQATSAIQSSSDSRFVDPSLQPSTATAASPVPSSEGTAPESDSRRESVSSTMRTQTVPFEGPPTQTPTGRISKAKKGKRVHACSYEGCGKVCDGADRRMCLRLSIPFHALTFK